MFRNVAVMCASAVAVAICVAGCAGMNRQIAETKARGTIESGGYTWTIPTDSEGGNTIKTYGLPSRQAATDVSSKLCKKYGRVAQYVDQHPILLTGAMIFDFNCVR